MDIRENVLQKRYFMKDSEGNVIEDWEGLCKRVSKALSTTEEEEKQFFNVIFNCLFLPNTPTLVNAGKKEKLSWSACFSLPIEDSIESIFDAVKTSAIIYKSGGGVGYNFSKLRAKNSLVGSTKGVASGPVSFMQVFDAATEAIKQGGVRRGAAIGILNCDHPDILDFIKCKSIEGKMSNFNISVGITNKFMEDVKNKEPRTLEIWNAIVDRAWENGEPGLVFFDTVNKYNLTPHLGRMESCNPCVVGNTLVAVADGRNMVTIQKLAEEEKDIPVYCLDISKDELCIKYGRNPRKTGSKVPVYKVYLTNNESIIVSNNHKFILSSGGEKTTLELKSGDSLFSFSKHQYPNTTTGKLYWNLSVKSNEIKEHKLLGEFYYGKIPSTNCFHHKNFNSLDNRKENIQVVLKSFHNKIHHDFIGEKNPMWGKHHSKETKLKIKQKAIKRMTDVYKQNLSEKLKYAWLENRESFNIGLKKLAENRLKETQLKTDLPCILIDNYVYVKKNCEVCGEEMLLHFFQREKAFCSHSCGNKGRYGTHKISNNELLEMGIKCKENTGKLTWKSWIKFGENINNRPNHKILKQRFGSFNSFKDKVASFNHKVIKVEFVGYEDVYNITVDNFHNICYITEKEGRTRKGYPKISGIITRQCGEIFLYPYEVCCLGSINLSKIITNNNINWELLKEITEIGVVMLDNLIDKQSYPIPKIKETHKGNRKIGLGIMGWADMLIKLKISYNSKEALDLSEKIMKYISEVAQRQSEKLAEEKEVFPNWEGSTWHQNGIKIRNATLTTVAPTGSISIIAECSSGIEPNFDWVTIQKRVDGEFEVTHPLYAEWKGKKLPPYFITSKEIPYEQHIKMQASFQKYISNSISKTINFPNSATKDDVEKAYMLAYELECKGVTIYRDGSRKTQVISTKDSTTLPDVLDAKRVRVKTPDGNIYLIISLNPDPIELFVTVPDESKYGGGENYDALARIFSLALRNKCPVGELLTQLDKANRKYGSMMSIPAAIIKGFRMININGTIEKCPDCGGELRTEESCQKCNVCGFTKC